MIVAHLRVKGRRHTVLRHAAGQMELFVSAMTVQEVEYGAFRAGRISDFRRVSRYLRVLAIDKQIARRAGQIRAFLVQQNLDIGLADTLIAATTLVHRLPLLTLNPEHFRRVGGLTVLGPQDLR